MSILRLEEHVRHIWQSAKVLSDKTLGEVLDDQGISQKTVERIMAGI